MDQDCSIYHFASFGDALAVLALTAKHGSVEVIECAPIGKRGQLIALGLPQDLDALAGEIRTAEVVRATRIRSLDPRTVESYLGHQVLENSVSSVLVLEADFLGSLWQSAEVILSNGGSLIELRQQKVEPGCSHLIAGFSEGIIADRVASLISSGEVTVTHIRNVDRNAVLKPYLSLDAD